MSHASQFDAVIVGAGFGGMYMLHNLRKLGLSVCVYEAGSDVGGTWYWNRYPGARCDSESVFYMFSDHVSEEILKEWTWSERFSGQPEILRYLQFVADKLEMRPHIQFNTRVTAAGYDEVRGRWQITTADGGRAEATYLITAVGCISETNLPRVPGLETFQGPWYHTGKWPHEPVHFDGQTVAVIGTGATGVQLVPEVAKEARHLYVFQRTPNYDIPGRNRPLNPEYVDEVKAGYGSLWAKARTTGFGLPYEGSTASALSVTEEERRRAYEAAWSKGGFYIGLDTYGDFLINRESNATIAEFVREQIRQTVRKPEVAELLAPKDHAFFTKRPPLENGYYEAFNRDNVTLIDLRSTPIESITPTGIRTSGGDYPVDAIIFATGFDTMTGTLFKMDIRGRGGVALRDRWAEGPTTYLGLMTHGFPNLFMITGPQSPSVLTNMVMAIEQHAEWIADCVRVLRERHIAAIEPTPEAEAAWVEHAAQVAGMTLLLEANSWWVGANIPGKPRLLYPYVGGLHAYRQRCDQVARDGYAGFSLTPAAREERPAPAASQQHA